MRIIGNIDHPSLKITVFKMDNRLSVKFETGLYEQTYKIREQEGMSNFEDIQNIVDEPFIEKIMELFPKMHFSKMQAISRNFQSPNHNEFDKIV